MALGEFLRNRRERIVPRDAGLSTAGRRRTPGLRREEVAQLAGVSVAWYTWLEQGREIRPSSDVLDAIAGALRLTAEERTHAFALAGRDAPRDSPAPPPHAAPAAMRAVLDALTFPAYISDRAWNVLAWNELADEIFAYSRRPPADRNTLLIAFGDPTFRAMLIDAGTDHGHVVASFRRVHDESPDDPLFEALLARLRVYPEFRRQWERHDVQRRPVTRKALRHPQLGALYFEGLSLTSGTSELRLVIFVPDAPTATKLAARRAPASRRSTRGS
jgi:transcriptional regulator with XRE-family HTH domain